MLALTSAAGVKMVHLPSKGAGETLTAMLRGDIHITESNVASNIGAVRDGRIKAYAVTAEQRLADLPEVPTMAEAGFPGMGSLNWNGLFAPVRTPGRSSRSCTRDRRGHERSRRGRHAQQEQLPVSLSATPDDFRAFVQAEAKRGPKSSGHEVRID